MKTQFTRNWWSFALNGIIALIYGILALSLPKDTLIVIARYTGIVIILTGVVFGIISYNRARKQLPYGIMLFQTIVMALVGFLIVLYTQQTIDFFVTLIGIWAIIMGIIQLIVLVNVSGTMGNKNFFLVNAIVSLLFGLLLVIDPFNAAKTLILLSGILALFFGFVMIWFAYNLREMQKTTPYEEIND
ncbi:MAG: DUF308 domain-containing protein [Bacteroidetes bacterium]|jgi:uncharacterized membrane protein HdeD (DUF308 family)|nr:DUF308 domain-containing protein [Bacteroidota bacterium]